MTEPYAWVDVDGFVRYKKYSEHDTPLYTAKTEWQGLTLADIDDLEVGRDWIAGARWAEAKLKEKNTSC